MHESAFPLEPSPDEMRALADQAMERIVAHISSLPAQPAADTKGAAEVARSLREAMPEEGTDLAELLSLLFDRAIPKTFNTAGPGYLAYIPGGGLFDAALADFIATASNRYVGVWAAAPALVQLETNVVRWLCELAGFPKGSGGLLTSGGSLANFSAIVAARRERLPENFLSGTIYVSDQTHHSVQKAALLAGFPPANVRSIASDAAYRVEAGALCAAIERDRKEGFSPFLIVGNGGTTNTGAVDDLGALADIAAEERLWFHVDAAYGGFFLLTERGKKKLAGIERADSVTLDPHKGMFLPYGTGSLLVRDAGALMRSHALHAEYLPPLPDAEDMVDFSQISPELSRDFRGLRVWLPLKRHGAAAFRRALDEKLDLTTIACEAIRAIPGIEIVAEPQLSLFAFRYVKPGLDAKALDRLNEAILDRVNEINRVHITGTRVDKGFVLRICVLSFRTHRDRIDAAVEDVRRAVEELG